MHHQAAFVAQGLHEAAGEYAGPNHEAVVGLPLDAVEFLLEFGQIGFEQLFFFVFAPAQEVAVEQFFEALPEAGIDEFLFFVDKFTDFNAVVAQVFGNDLVDVEDGGHGEENGFFGLHGVFWGMKWFSGCLLCFQAEIFAKSATDGASAAHRHIGKPVSNAWFSLPFGGELPPFRFQAAFWV